VPANIKKEPILKIELLFCCLLLVLVILFIVLAGDYKPQTSRVPFAIMYPLALMLLGQIVLLLKRLKNTNFSLINRENSDNFFKGTKLILSIISLLLLIYLTGHLAGISIFLIFFLKFISKKQWVLSIISGLSVSVVLYLVFQVLFKMSLYPGILIRIGLIGS